MARKLKNMENETHTCMTLNMARNTEKGGKWKIHTVGPVVWQENWKSWKMRNTYSRTWNMARNSEKREKCERITEGPVIWGENWKK